MAPAKRKKGGKRVEGESSIPALHLTLMRPPFVKRQTHPLSGFLLFFSAFRILA
jgi:hypothetical protein